MEINVGLLRRDGKLSYANYMANALRQAYSSKPYDPSQRNT